MCRQFIAHPTFYWKISPEAILLVLICAVVLFFRLYQLDQVPGEMFSDHAEKLADVSDVLNGQLSVFFPRNTGREAIQMYLTAAVSILFNTGLSFMSLKIGTRFMWVADFAFYLFIGERNW